jgi:DNA polymerase-1
MSDGPILFIDSLNLFLRSYAAYPSMSSHGFQIGGAVGYMKTLGRLIETLKPSRVYIAWEGGGSSRRRALFKEYKLNRKPVKLNRFYEGDLPDTVENKEQQIKILVELLMNVPICQIYVPDCEADDVIAHLKNKYPNEQKYIVSSDKDFYQLLDDNTRIYNLHKKVILDKDYVLQEFRVTAQNFALTKTLSGDTSDNIDGVPGIGFKTAAKRFPMLGSDEEIYLDQIISYAATHKNESKIYEAVVNNEDKLKRNWKLVYLGGAMVSLGQQEKIENIITTYTPHSNKLNFIKKLIEHGIGTFDANSFFIELNSLERQ